MTTFSERLRVRRFHSHATARAVQLDGIALATYWQRWVGFLVDTLVAVVLWAPLEFVWRNYVLHEKKIELRWDFHEHGNLVAMLLYWGLMTYFTNGWTVGKWAVRSRVVSLTRDRLGLWQSFERVLGYGAALLEAGLGVVQIFWDRNRMCAQDRLAETIVVDVRRRAQVVDKVDVATEG